MGSKNESNKDNSGLIYAHFLGSSEMHDITWRDVAAKTESNSPLWLHLDRTEPHVEEWLKSESGIEEEVIESLLRDDTRPRFSEVGEGQILLILKGVNSVKGTCNDEILSLRMWTDGKKLITLGFKPLSAVTNLIRLIKAGKSPKSMGELLLQLIQNIESNIEPLIYNLSRELDNYEESPSSEMFDVAELKSKTMELRRHLVPQRDVLGRMRQSNIVWLKNLRSHWREMYYALEIFVDELSDLRDRFILLQEAKNQELLHQTNQTMYLLSIVAAIFLPLTFLTGLLGINVGGIPGSNSPTAFWIVSIATILVGVLEIIIFKIKKWL